MTAMRTKLLLIEVGAMTAYAKRGHNRQPLLPFNKRWFLSVLYHRIEWRLRAQIIHANKETIVALQLMLSLVRASGWGQNEVAKMRFSHKLLLSQRYLLQGKYLCDQRPNFISFDI